MFGLCRCPAFLGWGRWCVWVSAPSAWFGRGLQFVREGMGFAFIALPPVGCRGARVWVRVVGERVRDRFRPSAALSSPWLAVRVLVWVSLLRC